MIERTRGRSFNNVSSSEERNLSQLKNENLVNKTNPNQTLSISMGAAH